jgi:c(7)-type cytochrome triheme protein
VNRPIKNRPCKIVLCALFYAIPAVLQGAEQPITVNRLLKPHSMENRLLKEDGIHDPANPEIAKLKEPTAVLQELQPAKSGNFVDWVISLEKSQLMPAYDAKDASQQAMPMDLDIVIAVKGSAPNVLFRHKPHLYWLECNNCHTTIFQPKKGANKTSMDQILRGESCGVCHGQVAFPINDCERCHSQKK